MGAAAAQSPELAGTLGQPSLPVALPDTVTARHSTTHTVTARRSTRRDRVSRAGSGIAVPALRCPPVTVLGRPLLPTVRGRRVDRLDSALAVEAEQEGAAGLGPGAGPGAGLAGVYPAAEKKTAVRADGRQSIFSPTRGGNSGHRQRRGPPLTPLLTPAACATS